MEFFEFDNTFISGYHSKHTSLGAGKSIDVGGNLKMPCSQVQNYKSGTFSMPSQAEHDAMQQYCIDNYPYAVSTDNGKTKGFTDRINLDRKFE